MKKLLALALCALTLVFACAAAMADASITFQMGGEPECMDPTINDYSSGSYALQSLFRGLYKYDADGALIPAMAESYEVSEDGCTYTFKLKEGLKWSDGSPLTAHDFEYSWKRVLNPDVGSETAYTLYSVIKDGYECFVSKTVAADDLPIRALDDTRLVDEASGWYDQGGGDVYSLHNYFYPLRVRPQTRTVALSEYGGIAWPMPGHEPPRKTYGYGTAKSREELTARYKKLQLGAVLPQLQKGLSALVYTQLTDVEDEVNGLFTYDRTAIKPDANAVRSVNAALAAEFARVIK